MESLTSSEELVAIRVTGADARTFLQGQLTCDVRKAVPGKAVWGALCTGQGRVEGLVTLVPRAEDLLLVLPLELADGALSRLQRFTLSSKVAFERLAKAIVPLTAAEASQLAGELPPEPGDYRSAGDLLVLRLWGSPARYLCVGLGKSPASSDDNDRAARFLAFRRSDLAAGVPRVYRATQGLFVPQTLNLDLLGGVSFDKGCYVGQEVVARARRGGVPRRMLGYSTRGDAPAPGTVVTLDDQEVGHVVDAVAGEASSELLAVVDLVHAAATLQLRGYPDSALALRDLPYPVPLERK